MTALSKAISAALDRDIPERVEPVTLTLPMPPSANDLFRNTTAEERARMRRTGRPDRPRCKTARYRTWIQAASIDYRAQRIIGQFRGDVAISLLIERSSVRDVDNCLKACPDFLKRMGLLKDDKQVKGFDGIWWSDTVKGVQIAIRPLDDSGATRARAAA